MGGRGIRFLSSLFRGGWAGVRLLMLASVLVLVGCAGSEAPEDDYNDYRRAPQSV